MEDLFRVFLDHFGSTPPLSRLAQAEICGHLSILHLPKKHILIRENQRHHYAYFVIKGAVRSYYLKDDVEVNTWFALENDMVGSLRNAKDLPSRETMELIEDSTLISIDLAQLVHLGASNVHIANFINAILTDYATFLEDRIYFSQKMSAMDKYLILQEQEPELLQRIPLTYIASYLGMSRETLSRLRAK